MFTPLEHSREFERADKSVLAREIRKMAESFSWIETRRVRRSSSSSSRFPTHEVILDILLAPTMAYLCYAITFAFPIFAEVTRTSTFEDGTTRMVKTQEMYGVTRSPSAHPQSP